MSTTLKSVARIFLIVTSVMFIISLIFEGFIFNTLQLLLMGSIFSLALSLYANKKENQSNYKKRTKLFKMDSIEWTLKKETSIGPIFLCHFMYMLSFE